MSDARLSILPGSVYLIRSLGPDQETAQRLAQMGVLPGNQLQIVRTSPFGETLEVTVGQGDRFALRRSDLARLDYTPVALPLSSPLIELGRPYRIHTLAGGKTFRERLSKRHLAAGSLIQVKRRGPHRITVTDAVPGTAIDLGRGEAAKIIVELRPGETPA